MTNPTSDPGEPAFVSMAFMDIPDPDFADVTVVGVPAAAGPMNGDPEWWAGQIFSVHSMPRWIKALFAIRQALVGLVGISRGDGGSFAVAEVRGEEALISTDERHLDFRAAVGIDTGQRLVRVTTVVRLHGWRGRLYFAPVSVLHGPVARAMLKAAVRRNVAGMRH